MAQANSFNFPWFLLPFVLILGVILFLLNKFNSGASGVGGTIVNHLTPTGTGESFNAPILRYRDPSRDVMTQLDLSLINASLLSAMVEHNDFNASNYSSLFGVYAHRGFIFTDFEKIVLPADVLQSVQRWAVHRR